MIMLQVFMLRSRLIHLMHESGGDQGRKWFSLFFRTKRVPQKRWQMVYNTYTNENIFGLENSILLRNLFLNMP